MIFENSRICWSSPLFTTPGSVHQVFPQLKKSLKGRKISFNQEMLEVVETWFPEQVKISFFKVLEALQVDCNKCIQLRENVE